MIKDLTDNAGAAISWAYNAINTKSTEIVNVSGDNEQGVLVIGITHNIGGATAAFNVYAGVDATSMTPVMDSVGNAITFYVSSTKKVFHLANCHATYIQLVFTANGTTSGSITGIKLIAK